MTFHDFGWHLSEARPPKSCHVTMCTWAGPNRSGGLSYHNDFVELCWDSIGVGLLGVLTIGQNLIICLICFISAEGRQGTIWVI